MIYKFHIDESNKEEDVKRVIFVHESELSEHQKEVLFKEAVKVYSELPGELKPKFRKHFNFRVVI